MNKLEKTKKGKGKKKKKKAIKKTKLESLYLSFIENNNI